MLQRVVWQSGRNFWATYFFHLQGRNWTKQKKANSKRYIHQKVIFMTHHKLCEVNWKRKPLTEKLILFLWRQTLVNLLSKRKGNVVVGYVCLASILHYNVLDLFTWLELNHSFTSNVPMQFPNFSSLITVNEYYEVILKHIRTVPSKLCFMSIYIVTEV